MAAGQDFVGPYRVISQLISGQTSAVYEVMRRGETKRYALKMLLSDFRKDRTHVGYLRREFEVARGMEHERIIRMFDLDSAPTVGEFLVMELFPWPNMKYYTARDVSKIAFLVPKVLKQAAEGLAHFHSHGWIHRDIKPDNLLMSLEGEVKLIDFALATKKASFIERLFSRRQKNTQGTRSYMSPEQIRGQPLDHRSDIYSFGCVMHELIHGKPPFAGFTANELLQKHLSNTPPSLLALSKNVTEDFAKLVLRMLSKDRKNRPDSMDDVVLEMSRLRIFRRTPDPPGMEVSSEHGS